MKVANAVAEILKREGIEFLIGYPVNPIIEAAAEADIRTIMVRQERIGLHMCDAIAKVTSGDRIGVFAMQHGPGTENAFGGVAQSYGDSCPTAGLPLCAWGGEDQGELGEPPSPGRGAAHLNSGSTGPHLPGSCIREDINNLRSDDLQRETVQVQMDLRL
jgi:hypothetical protein